MSLVDANNRPIQECNVLEDDSHVYVGDRAQYEKLKEKKLKFQWFSGMAGGATLLFLCIFMLNFSSGGFNAANLLLITLAMIGLNGSAYLVKQYMSITTQLDNMEAEGRPCYTGSNVKQIFT